MSFMKKVLKNIVNFTIILVIILPLFTTNIFAYEEQEVDKLLEEYKFGEAYKILKENLYDEDKNIDPIKIRKILELEFIVTDTSSMILHALELVEYGQNSKDYYNQMIGYYYLGSVYYELYDDTKAIENFEKMLSIAQSKNYPLGKGMYYMFTGLIYSSYEDYDLALENFTKAQPYFEEAHLDENWIFPNFKENNKFMIDLIEIILSKSQDKASRFVELGDAFKDKNWKLKYSSMSRCGYELNKIGAFKEAAYMLEESKKTIALADFGDMYNKFSGSMDYDLAYSYYNMGDYKRASELLIDEDYTTNDTKLEVERGELINQKLREIESKEIKRQSETKTKIISAISALLVFLLITVMIIVRQYKVADRLSQEVYERSIRDNMTGLFNRTEIINLYQKNIDKDISLSVIDIDDFKNINDTYGHSVGDIVIKDISSIIQDIVGDKGYVGRYGGEEFLVILKKSDQYDSKKLLEEIRIIIENKKWFFKDSPVTVSIGLLNEAKNTSFNNGFKAADELLYLAKRNGKNIICHI